MHTKFVGPQHQNAKHCCTRKARPFFSADPPRSPRGQSQLRPAPSGPNRTKRCSVERTGSTGASPRSAPSGSAASASRKGETDPVRISGPSAQSCFT